MTRACALAWLVALGLVLPGCGSRQPVPVMPEAADRVAVAPDPGGSAVAVAALFPGSAWELPGTEGLTLLTAETLLERVRPALSQLGARVEVQCDRTAFTFLLVAPSARWKEAVDTLLEGLFRPRPTLEALTRARKRLAAALSLDAESPAWQARLAADAAVYGDTLAARWVGPACGVPELLPRFGLEHVRAGAHRFGPHAARLALTGPVERRSAEAVLGPRLTPEPAPTLPRPPEPGPGTRYVERNTVTAWVSVAYPFGTGADAAALRHLGALVEHALGPGPERPGVLALSYAVERHGGGGTLILQSVVLPDEAGAHVAALRALVRERALEDVPERTWTRVSRRLLGRELLRRERPEVRAAEIAWSEALGEPWSEGWPEDAPGPARVRRAAGALGEPGIAIVGPRTARPASP